MSGSSPWRLLFRASAALALIAGLLLFAGATRTEDYFSWTIAPAQTAAFLGAAYWAAAVLFSWASAQRSWTSLRIAFFPELTVAVLLLIATFTNLEQVPQRSVRILLACGLRDRDPGPDLSPCDARAGRK